MKTSLILIFITLALSVFAADNNTDYVSQVPDWPENWPGMVYSGYLDVTNSNRSLHYVLIKAKNNTLP